MKPFRPATKRSILQTHIADLEEFRRRAGREDYEWATYVIGMCERMIEDTETTMAIAIAYVETTRPSMLD